MEINPYAMLEVTLDENPEIETQPSEDPLNVDMPYLDESKSRMIANRILYNYNLLNTVTDEEAEYRCQVFKDSRAVLKRRLHCTICDIHIGCYPNVDMDDLTHPLLNVLSCASCKREYCRIDFSIIKMGKDIRCRWCSALASDAIPLRFCSQCPFGFCEKCISRNLPLETTNDQCWLCCVCNMRSLWEARATLWGLRNHIERARVANTKWAGDLAQCCKKKPIRKSSVLPLKNFNMMNGRCESYAINPYNNNNINNNNYSQHNNNNNCNNNNNNNNNNQELIYYQQHQHVPTSAVQQERFIIETAAVKKKLAFISSLVSRIQAFVDKTAAELTDYAKDEYLKTKVGNVSSFVALSAEQLAAASKTLALNFEKQLELAKRARTEPQNGQQLLSTNINNINHQLQVPQMLPMTHQTILHQQQQLHQSVEQQHKNNAIQRLSSLVTKPVQNLASFSLGPTGELTAQFVGFSADGTIAAHQLNSNLIQNGVQLIDQIPSTSSPKTSINNNNHQAIIEPSILQTLPTTINNDKTLSKTPQKTIRKKSPKKILQKKSPTNHIPQKRKYTTPKKKSINRLENIIEFNGIPIKKCYIKLTKLSDEQLKQISYKDGHANVCDNFEFIK